MISTLLSSTIGKAVGAAVVGAIFLTGAAGASAATGGPNLPAQAVSALGLNSSHNSDVNDVDHDADFATPTATATTTLTADVNDTATPETQSFFGLCNAWSHGSDKGQANKQQAQGFAGLITAAGGTDKVADFCKTVAKPNETASPDATTAGAAATSTPNPDSNLGQGNANGHSGGRPDGVPTPPAR